MEFTFTHTVIVIVLVIFTYFWTLYFTVGFGTRKRLIEIYRKLDLLLTTVGLERIDLTQSAGIKHFQIRHLADCFEQRIDQALKDHENLKKSDRS
ncbi:MAG: hypothetical protein ACYTG7_08395 [Planctomycetota bacterium]|jgi:hypothetical protein